MSEERVARRWSTAGRVAGGSLVLLGCTRLASQGVSTTEERAFSSMNGGPAWVAPVLWAPMQLGSLWGPFAVGAWAWRRWHRWRPAVGAVVAGVVSWQLAKVVKVAVGRGRPADLLDGVARSAGTPRDGLGFVSGHSAVAASLLAVLSPQLTAGERLAARALVALVGAARVQVSAHMPLDVAGGVALGYAVGWGWNLVVGEPVS
jgi:undecaprenyl-diphosphatase